MKSLPQFRRDPRRILCKRNCLHCGASFPVARKYPQQRFCGRRCGLLATVLTNEHQRKAGRVGSQSQADIRRGTGTRSSYVKIRGRHAHRVMAEVKLGRALLPGEVVQLRDGNGKNYASANLRVFTSRSAYISAIGIKK